MTDLVYDLLQGRYVPTSAPPKKAKSPIRGCAVCPLGKRVNGQLIRLPEGLPKAGTLWFGTPTSVALKAGFPISGRQKKFLIRELRRVGLSPSDFDWQNVFRCRPVSRDATFGMVARMPTKAEQDNCAAITDRVMYHHAGHQSVMLVFGAEAQVALLGRQVPQESSVFWSDKYQCRVFALDSLETVLAPDRPEWLLPEWRAKLEAAAFFIRNPGRFAFVENLKFRRIRTAIGLRKVAKAIRQSGSPVAVDIEDGVIRGRRRILMVGLSWSKDAAVTVLLDHPGVGLSAKRRAALIQELKTLLEDGKVSKWFHYGSTDCEKLRKLLGIKVRGYIADTMYNFFLANTWVKKVGLAAIADLRYPLFAGYKDILSPHLKAMGKDVNYANIPLATLSRYNGADAALTWRIGTDTRHTVTGPLAQVYVWAGWTLMEMESRGPKFDTKYYADVVSIVPKRLRYLESKLRQLADSPELNLSAPKDVASVLFDRLGLPDPSGKRSTDEDNLRLILEKEPSPFVDLFLEYRELDKMQSTYLTGYQESARLNNGELRTKWYLTGAVTGRLRSGGKREGHTGVVNMQNLHGSAMLQNLLISDFAWRDVLSAAESWTEEEVLDRLGDLWVFVAADYSQIEIRMLAECSQDPLLLSQFASGDDIHSLVGHTITGWSVERIRKDKATRTLVKNLHFGMVYGLSPKGLYHYLRTMGIKITERRTEKLHRAYFKRYKGVLRFIQRMRAFALERGYVDSLFGFRRRVGNYHGEGRGTNPENQAVNSPIQGAAHQLMLNALAMLHTKKKTFALLQQPLMEVHDALVFRVRLRDLVAAYRLVKDLLEKAVPEFTEKVFGRRLKVPLLAEVDCGFRYGVKVPYTGQPLREFLLAWQRENQAVETKVQETYLAKAA